MSNTFEVRYWFGSPFGGSVCDDGDSGSLGQFTTSEEAKARLAQFCASQRCDVELAADGMSAGFYNFGGSCTGGAKIGVCSPVGD